MATNLKEMEELVREKMRLETQNEELKRQVYKLQVQLGEARRLAGVPKQKIIDGKVKTEGFNFREWILTKKKWVYIGILGFAFIVWLINLIGKL